jgi:DNA-binding transcriptional LysR family regulator
MSVSPPLRKLQYALAVAREAHFRKAAERVNVSQPTLSRQVRELEDEIGLELFQRDSHPVALTTAGQAFIAVVEEMMLKVDTDFQRAKDAARHALRRTSTSITIGHSAFVSSSFRREIRSALSRKFNYLQVQFRTVFASELVSSINSRVVDLGLTFTSLDFGGLEQMPVRTERLCVVVSQDSVLIGKPAVTLADVKSHPLIVACSERAHPILYARLLEECRASGFRPTIAEEVTFAQEAFDFVEEKVGVAILPYGVCEEAPPSIRYFPISGIEPLKLVFLRRPDDGLAAEILGELAEALAEKKLECAC